MPSRRYALEPGQPERLELSWDLSWKNIRLRLDDQVIGEVENYAALREGRSFVLPDGSTISVKFNTKFEVERNGRALTSSADSNRAIRSAASLIMTFGLFMVYVVVSGFMRGTLIVSVPALSLSIATGIIFVVLGIFMFRKSAVAVYLALGLFVLDTALNVVANLASLRGLNFVFIIRLVILLSVIQAAVTVRRLQR